jgi:DNA polymerase III alpha subunit
MRKDKYGQLIYSEDDICRMMLEDRERHVKYILVDKPIPFSDELELKKIPKILEYVTSDQTIDEFDERLQSNWHMPEEYKNLDIVVWLLDKCQNDTERQRVGHELLLYVDRNLLPLLQYLKYIVDLMREHNIIWGVGRGSSVSSYVLFLIGVHKIDSIFHDLRVEEFLK